MENSEACTNCGSNVRSLYEAPNGEDMCIDCYRLRFPPFMILMKYTTGNMFNLYTGKYESIHDPEDLEICGWEVKLIQVLPNDTMVIYLEYYGDVQCSRCDDYRFPLPGGYCTSQACMNHREKLPPEKVVHPCWPSFYLTWKYGMKTGSQRKNET